MISLFVGAAEFLLEAVASLGVGKVGETLTSWFSNKKLSKSDEKIREYLQDHLSESQYDDVDRFLAAEGIYSHDQVTANWSVLAKQTEELIENFFDKYPSLKQDQKTLVPLLERTIITTYETIVAQLSSEGKILYNQTLQNRAQSRHEHQEIKDILINLEKKLSQPSAKLLYSEVINAFDALSQIIHSGNWGSGDSLICLMESQIDERDRSFCTALKIFLKGYVGTVSELDVLCIQFLRESPSQELIVKVVCFLLQMEHTSSLKHFLHAIDDEDLSILINDYINEKSSHNKVKSIVDEDGKLKKKFDNIEYALWVIANLAMENGDKATALVLYSKIDDLNSSLWSRWSIAAVKASLLISDALISQYPDTTKIREHVNVLEEFSEEFKQLSNDLCIKYLEVYLTCASFLPFEEFEKCYKQLEFRYTEIPQVKKQWFTAQLSAGKTIDETELKCFCDQNSDKSLWSVYLFHRVADDPNYVVNYIEKDEELLTKEITAIVAYYEALSIVQGEDIAFKTVANLSISKEVAFACNIFFAKLCTKQTDRNVEDYLQKAMCEALNPTSDIMIFYLRDLISFLISLDRHQEAEEILEKYQDRDPALMLLRLEILVAHEQKLDVCSCLIEKLECVYAEDPRFLFCKGSVNEKELLGSGMELFTEAFILRPSVKYAYAALAARLNRKIFVDDDVLSFAEKQDNVSLLHLCGVTYARQGQNQKAHRVLLQALIYCGDNYNESLYQTFVHEHIGNHEHESPPNKIETGTCCILANKGTGENRNIWIQEEDISLPRENSNFAGYQHISPNDKTAFLLLELSNGASVSIDDVDYEVRAINYGDVIAAKYCMQALVKNGAVQELKFDKNDLDGFFETVRQMSEHRSNHIQETVDMYKDLNPGMPLDLFARGINQPYYKAIRTLLCDSEIPFLAGSDGVSIDKECVMTPSSIVVLSFLGIRPPKEPCNQVKFYVPNALKGELAMQSIEHRNDQTKAVLGFSEDGRPYMLENNLESKRMSNMYFSCLNEWVTWAETTDSILPQDYPSEIKLVVEGVGVPNVEAIVVAQRKNCLICCDDLVLRRYMRTVGIESPTAVDVLIHLNYPFDYVLEKVGVLVECNYIFPVTLNFINWVSKCFELTENEEQLGQYSILVIDLLQKIVNNKTMVPYFLALCKQLMDENVKLHPTLKWIITSVIKKCFPLSS